MIDSVTNPIALDPVTAADKLHPGDDPPNVAPVRTQQPPQQWVVSPLDRPYGIGRFLAGFADSALLHDLIPTFPFQSPNARQQIEARLGRGAAAAPVSTAGRPGFERVSEDAVVAFLSGVAQALAATEPASVVNLGAFEWVEIAPLIAGHLLTGGMPNPEQGVLVEDDLAAARFCMLSYSQQTQMVARADGEVSLTTPLPHEVVPHNFGFENGILTIQYSVRPRLDPIRVWSVDGVAIALTGLGRLTWLLERGYKRALCAVSYGYGTDVLGRLPTVPESILRAPRPPVMRDFLDDTLSVAVAVRERETTSVFGVRTFG